MQALHQHLNSHQFAIVCTSVTTVVHAKVVHEQSQQLWRLNLFFQLPKVHCHHCLSQQAHGPITIVCVTTASVTTTSIITVCQSPLPGLCHNWFQCTIPSPLSLCVTTSVSSTALFHHHCLSQLPLHCSIITVCESPLPVTSGSCGRGNGD